MAEKRIELEVALKPHIEGIKNDTAALSGLKDKKGKTPFDAKPGSKDTISGLVTELEKLSKIANPTKKDINDIVSCIAKANNELISAAKAWKGVSKEFEAAENSYNKALAKRDQAQKRVDTAKTTNGVYNEETKKFSYTKTYAQQWAKSQNAFTYASGSHAGQKASWTRIQQAGISGDFSAFQNPKQAQQSYTKFIAGQDKIAAEIQVLEAKVVELTNTVASEKEKMENVAKSDAQRNPATAIAAGASARTAEAKDTARELKEQIAPAGGGSGESQETIDTAASTELLNQKLQGTQSLLGKVTKKFAIYNLVVQTLKRALKETVKTITDLDKYLTEQAMVTGKTRKQTYELLKSYQDLATQCGATTKEVAEVATQFLRQGKTTEEALTLTKAAVSAAKVAGISATDSVNYLTTALNGFQLAADQAMTVSDKFAAVAANAAVSYDEVAIALSKVASQANLAGMSIDYTTALLAKGIETTREAPETIGTALKTVIARMREMSDYGETLEGDTDVNNVETQLAYVGIALKNTNGELRSTEDVLDELGKKWDTLNTNQQAAVAKALAGTRQQSRLIAMMQDYDRVLELQEISERSQGATMAQMTKYSKSMEAAVNNVKVAWEKVVTAFVNSDKIIDLVNSVATVIERLLDTFTDDGVKGTAARVAAMTSLVVILGRYITLKLSERTIQREMLQLQQEQQKIDIETAMNNMANAERQNQLNQANTELEEANTEAAIADGEVKDLLAEKEIVSAEKVRAIQQKAAAEKRKEDLIAIRDQEILNDLQDNKGANKASIEAKYAKQIASAKGQVTKASNQLAKATAKETEVDGKLTKAQTKLETAQKKQKAAADKVTAITTKTNDEIMKGTKNVKEYNALAEKKQLIDAKSNVTSTLSLGIMNAMTTATQILNFVKSIGNVLDKAREKQQKKTAAATGVQTAATKGQTVAQTKLNLALYKCPLVWFLSIILLVVAGVALLTVGIIALVSALTDTTSSAKKAAKNINELSAEIYELSQKAQKIDNITDSFEALDNKIIKTRSDLEEMNTLLDEASDILSSEDEEDSKGNAIEGTSEQDKYNALTTDKAKYEYLKAISEQATREANEKRQEQLDIINALGEKDLNEFLNNPDNDTEITEARDAIYAINNNTLYETIDKYKELLNLQTEEASAVEEVVAAMLEELDAREALNYANGQGVQNLVAILTSLDKIKTAEGEYLSVAELLADDTQSLVDRVAAYKAAASAIGADKAALEALQAAYSGYEVFIKMGDDVVEFIDKVGLSIDEINDLWSAYEAINKAGNLNITQKEWEDRFQTMMQTLADTNGNISETISTVFADYLSEFEEGTDEFYDAWNAFVNALSDSMSVGMLNMGQNLESLGNRINNFYEKAQEWSTMSESEKYSFLSDNADLFAGDEDLYKAFQTGDYNAIEEALKSNETLQKLVQAQVDQIDQELAIEEARVGDDRNESYIAALKEAKEYWSDIDNLYKANLELRLEQQQTQLDAYKEYLQEEQEALSDSLDKRKEAYSDYFDAIGEAEDDEDYEEEASKYIANLSKLSSSTNADAMKKTADLEQKLEDLEKERLDELRERAQEKIQENIEDEIDEINEKFDDLLENEQAMLNLMSGALENPEDFISKMVASSIKGGNTTGLGIESFIQGLESTYGMMDQFSGFDWDSISAQQSGDSWVLNIGGQTVELTSSEEATLAEAIKTALTQIGKR